MSQFNGTLAELRVAIRATEKGLIPSRPLTEGCRYDLLLDDGQRIWRAQVKQGNSDLYNSGSICLDFRSANRPDGSSKKLCYTAAEIDTIIIYLPKTSNFYWLPPAVWDGKSSISLRLTPTRNGQTKNCIFADQFVW